MSTARINIAAGNTALAMGAGGVASAEPAQAAMLRSLAVRRTP